MRVLYRLPAWVAVLILAGTLLATAQTAYQPKFKGDPARSDSEAAALGYMRTVIRAQQQYFKKNSKYAATLADLVHTGSFTQRMTKSDRGDYTVAFHSRKDGYELTMTPHVLDTEHRSFYANEDATMHADEGKIADESTTGLT